MDQPGQDADPARRQLNKENTPFAPENVVVVSHIQRIGCQTERTTLLLHGG